MKRSSALEGHSRFAAEPRLNGAGALWSSPRAWSLRLNQARRYAAAQFDSAPPGGRREAFRDVSVNARILIVARDDALAGPLAEGLDRLGWRTITARGPYAAVAAVADLQIEAARRPWESPAS
jgi:hypothetical protein